MNLLAKLKPFAKSALLAAGAACVSGCVHTAENDENMVRALLGLNRDTRHAVHLIDEERRLNTPQQETYVVINNQSSVPATVTPQPIGSTKFSTASTGYADLNGDGLVSFDEFLNAGSAFSLSKVRDSQGGQIHFWTNILNRQGEEWEFEFCAPSGQKLWSYKRTIGSRDEIPYVIHTTTDFTSRNMLGTYIINWKVSGQVSDRYQITLTE